MNQRETLMRVIHAYASVMAPDLPADRMAALREAGLDKISFAWAGEFDRGKKHLLPCARTNVPDRARQYAG